MLAHLEGDGLRWVLDLRVTGLRHVERYENMCPNLGNREATTQNGKKGWANSNKRQMREYQSNSIQFNSIQTYCPRACLESFSAFSSLLVFPMNAKSRLFDFYFQELHSSTRRHQSESGRK